MSSKKMNSSSPPSSSMVISNVQQQVAPSDIRSIIQGNHNDHSSSSSSSNSNSNRRRYKKQSSCFPLNSSRVCFGTVTVLEFATIIGDHPEVQEGCPVALAPRCIISIVKGDDDHDDPEKEVLLLKQGIPLQTYECQKNLLLWQRQQQQQQQNQQRSCDSRCSREDCFRLTRFDREERLLQAGFSLSEIQQQQEAYSSSMNNKNKNKKQNKQADFQCRTRRRRRRGRSTTPPSPTSPRHHPRPRQVLVQLLEDKARSFLETTSRRLRKILPPS